MAETTDFFCLQHSPYGGPGQSFTAEMDDQLARYVRVGVLEITAGVGSRTPVEELEEKFGDGAGSRQADNGEANTPPPSEMGDGDGGSSDSSGQEEG